MHNKTIAIIGGGVSGLSVGCYLQMNGYRTRIFEKGREAGGLLASFRHNGIMEGRIHQIFGMGGNNNMAKTFNQLNAFKNTEKYFPDFIEHIEFEDGSHFLMPKEIESSCAQLAFNFPEDAEFLAKLCSDVTTLSQDFFISDVPYELWGMKQYFFVKSKHGTYFNAFKHFFDISVKSYISKVKSKKLKTVILSIIDESAAAIDLLMMLAGYNCNVIGFVRDSFEIGQNLYNRYIELGGRFEPSKEVASIKIENNQATGIILADGTVRHASMVVAACDLRHVYNKLLEGNYQTQKQYSALEARPLQPTGTLLCIKADMDLKANGISHVFKFKKGIPLGNAVIQTLNCYIMPDGKGKSLIQCSFECDYDDWAIHKVLGDYFEQKEKIASCVIQELEKRFSGISLKITNLDVTTPSTYERRCNNFRGAYRGFASIAGRKEPSLYVVRGLENFIICSQWTQSTGSMASAALAGRYASQLICFSDGIKFTDNSNSK